MVESDGEGAFASRGRAADAAVLRAKRLGDGARVAHVRQVGPAREKRDAHSSGSGGGGSSSGGGGSSSSSSSSSRRRRFRSGDGPRRVVAPGRRRPRARRPLRVGRVGKLEVARVGEARVDAEAGGGEERESEPHDGPPRGQVRHREQRAPARAGGGRCGGGTPRGEGAAPRGRHGGPRGEGGTGGVRMDGGGGHQTCAASSSRHIVIGIPHRAPHRLARLAA